MSLIEEALKKQQEEFTDNKKIAAANGPSQAPTTLAAQPPETPPTPPEDTGDKKRSLIPILGIVAVVLLLLIAAFWFLQSGLKQYFTPKIARPSPTNAVTPAVAVARPRVARPLSNAAPTTVASIPADTTPAAVAVPSVPAPSSPDHTALAPDTPPLPAPVAAAPTTSAPAATPTRIRIDIDSGAVASPPQPAAVEPTAVKEPVVWPALHLSAKIGEGKRGTARINNQMIVEGDTVDGVAVIAILKDGVRVSYQGEVKLLHIGGRLE